MKKSIVILVLLIYFSIKLVNAQFTFAVSPGLSFNSANVGYKINDKIVSFMGLQYLNVKMKNEESGNRYDPQLMQIVKYSEKDLFSLNLIVPNIGAKFYVLQKDKLKSNLMLNIAKPMISGKEKNNGQTNKDFEKEIKAMRMWAGEVGFGSEYFFDDNFSIGGEFGLRNFFYRSKIEDDKPIFDPSTGTYRSSEKESITKIMINPTYTRISLNFYF